MPEKRQVVTRSGRSMRGYFPSVKSGCVAYESPLEADACLLFEMSPGVLQFHEYQRRETYYDGTDAKSCYPDFEIEYSTGIKQLIEVKSSDALSNFEIKRKYDLIAEHFSRRNISFRRLTDTDIRWEPCFSNLQEISYFRPRYGDEFIAPAIDILKACDKKTFHEAALLIGNTRELLRCLARSLIHIKHTEKICNSTIIYHTQGADHDSLYF